MRRVAETAVALPDAVSPLALTTILVAVSRTLANEERVGITTGHDDVRQAVEWVLPPYRTSKADRTASAVCRPLENCQCANGPSWASRMGKQMDRT